MTSFRDVAPRNWGQRSTMLRRQREYDNAVRQQRARGRPDKSWRRCRDSSCTLAVCQFADPPPAVLRDRETNVDGIHVDGIWESYAREAATILWPREIFFGHRDYHGYVGPRQRALESLIKSPEVRLAFLGFRELCAAARFRPSRGQMSSQLVSILPRLRRCLRALENANAPPPVHRHTGAPDWKGEWWPCEIMMSFLLRVEVWRRSQHGRFRDWAFGRNEHETAEFLVAMLLQLWFMDCERCFDVETNVDERRWTELWGAWLQDYPPLPEGEAAVLFCGDDGQQRWYRSILPPPRQWGGRRRAVEAVLTGTGTAAGAARPREQSRP